MTRKFLNRTIYKTMEFEMPLDEEMVLVRREVLERCCFNEGDRNEIEIILSNPSPAPGKPPQT